MRIYIDFSLKKIEKIEPSTMYFGNENVDMIELYFKNFTEGWFATISAEGPDKRQIYPRLADTDGEFTITQDDILYHVFEFTLSSNNGWNLTPGRNLFYIWIEKDNKAQCVGSFGASVVATSGYYLIDNPYVNPVLRDYLDKTFIEFNKNILDGSPKGIYDNLEALQNDFPNGASGIYITLDDGYWNYWNGESWVKGYKYQIAQTEFADTLLEAKADKVALEIQKEYVANTLIPLNIEMEQGSLTGSGNNYSSLNAFRSVNWISFDEISYLFIKQDVYSNYNLIVYKKDNLGNVTQIGTSDGMLAFKRFVINDLTCTYRFLVSKPNATVMDRSEFDNIFFAMTNQQSVYKNLESNYSYKIDFKIGNGLIVNTDNLYIEGSSTGASFLNLLHFDNNGFLQVKNPTGSSIIIYTTNSQLQKIDRVIYTDFEFEYEVNSTNYYWISIYNPTSSYDNLNLELIFIKRNIENNEINLTFEKGVMNGAGNVESGNRVVSQKINTTKDKLYLILFPIELNVAVNIYNNNYNSRRNMGYFKAPFSVKGQDNFIRLAFKLDNDDEIDITNQYLDDVKVIELELENKNGYDITVSASNSEKKGTIICNGANDQQIIQSLLSCNESIKILFYGGDYYLTELYETNISGQFSALYTNDKTDDYHTVEIIGEHTTRETDIAKVKFRCQFAIPSSGENSAILVPRRETSLNTIASTQTLIKIDNISVFGNGYINPIVYIDCTSARASMISNVYVSGNGNTRLAPFETTPNENCVGIRVGHGSNNGIQNYVKHCAVIYSGKGFSICGEHFILEDNLSHHCYIGFAFGDILTRGNYEHPNIMIGCSIEGCYRLMTLNRYGLQSSTSERTYNTLIVIGMSTEIVWQIPLDIATEENQTSITLPILEVIQGAYRGRIEIDYPTIPFENGSGEHFKYLCYYSGGIIEN